ncbi:hypothetical protein Naga_100024g47 [Nannochloropsis gaditana]|uniref:Uncharacterized protein n=1 Tax=Nannochloropsis gaditana TaxID=72520 RepID=W7TSC8_9STRA|nr:hypothetical protein Naga_100024g47 [Nannochloropsis gaditana]
MSYKSYEKVVVILLDTWNVCDLYWSDAGYIVSRRALKIDQRLMRWVLPTISRLVKAERAFGSIILDRLNMEWEVAQKGRKTEDKEK